MDNLLEIIIPLIFAAIYFFGNMASGKDDAGSKPDSAPGRQSEGGDMDAAERQRRIQEEIRRKIMERRRAAQGPSDRELRERGEAVRERRAERERERREVQAPFEAASPSATSPSAEVQEPESPEAAFTWGSSENAYESEMQARLREIEATKRRAEQLKQQAGLSPTAPQTASSHTGRSERSSPHRGLLRGPARASLRDPAAARAAFIYAEVLGQPISQRKTPSVPGLS